MKKMMVVLALFLTGFAIPLPVTGQNGQRENGGDPNWPEACELVEITSTLDQEVQKAYFFRAKSPESRPLVISLHSWSAGFDQKDTLARMCVDNDFNYIHPDFRGPNQRPEAGGSPLVIRDIEDAIGYALRYARVDSSEIHVIGSSGGGHATLLTYMNTRHPVRTFSAWVPISNLVDWYYESVGRSQKYARDIAMVTNPEHSGPENYVIDEAEARRRSPFFMTTPADRRKVSKLNLYAGIHDGYTGSVPITQSLRFYNKVVQEFDENETASLVTTEEMLSLVERRNSGISHPAQVKKGDIHFQKQYQDKVQVTIFEGGHEMLPGMALGPLKAQKVLAIGDSNGALENGWVTQLRLLCFNDRFYNTSISGNTIGFDNLDRSELNTLSNVDHYLSSGARHLNGLDKIVILLGTNDCKAVFDDQLEEVPQNLAKLIAAIKKHPVYKRYRPKLYIISPPPYAPDEQLIPKYHGGAADVAWLAPRFREIALREGCIFVNVYDHLLPIWEEVSEDGIHLKPGGQKMIAEMIREQW